MNAFEPWVYQVALAIVLLFAIAYIVFIDVRKDHSWKFGDMFLTEKNGRPVADRQAFMLLGGWFVLTSWGTYWIVAIKELPEWFATLYAGYCVGSYSYSRWLKSRTPKETPK